MFPFWEKVVGPLLDAAEVRRVVEIGALRGENTQLMLDRLPDDAELHVIDPLPDFDPAEHRARFGGRYVFHRALSLDVLGDLPAMDAALVDGDHNWYTVINELRLLRDVARAADAPLPVLVLHDVGWPYGRRDLYYAPETIPEEHRQPWKRAGMRPGVSTLVSRGLNPTLANALEEGGPANGVMTALDDFMAEHDRPLRRVVLPVYFGLAIVVEEDLLARRPRLAAVLDHLESAAGKDELLALAESVRLDAAIFEHILGTVRDEAHDRLAHRYLERVLDDLARERGPRGPAAVGRSAARSAASGLRVARDRLRSRAGGTAPASEPDPTPTAPPVPAELRQLLTVLEDIRRDGIKHDLVVTGSRDGAEAVVLRAHVEAYAFPNRKVIVVDDPILGEDPAAVDAARTALARADLLDDTVRLGAAVGSLRRPVALLHVGDVGPDAVGPTLEALLPHVAVGGAVVIADVTDPRVADAVARVRARTPCGPSDRAGTALSWRTLPADADGGGAP